MAITLRMWLAASAVAAVAITACGSPSTRSATPSASATVAPSKGGDATTVAPPAVPAVSIPLSVANVVAKRHDVTISGCAGTATGWTATGAATNPGASPVSYEITVFFTTVHATDIDYAATTVTVAAGKSATWTVTKAFAPPGVMLCVLRGVA